MMDLTGIDQQQAESISAELNQTASNIYNKLRKSAQHKVELGVHQTLSKTIYEDYK